MADKKYLTLSEACEQLGISETQLSRMARSGMISTIEQDGQLLLDRADLDQFFPGGTRVFLPALQIPAPTGEPAPVIEHADSQVLDSSPARHGNEESQTTIDPEDRTRKMTDSDDEIRIEMGSPRVGSERMPVGGSSGSESDFEDNALFLDAPGVLESESSAGPGPRRESASDVRHAPEGADFLDQRLMGFDDLEIDEDDRDPLNPLASGRQENEAGRELSINFDDAQPATFGRAPRDSGIEQFAAGPLSDSISMGSMSLGTSDMNFDEQDRVAPTAAPRDRAADADDATVDLDLGLLEHAGPADEPFDDLLDQAALGGNEPGDDDTAALDLPNNGPVSDDDLLGDLSTPQVKDEDTFTIDLLPDAPIEDPTDLTREAGQGGRDADTIDLDFSAMGNEFGATDLSRQDDLDLLVDAGSGGSDLTVRPASGGGSSSRLSDLEGSDLTLEPAAGGGSGLLSGFGTSDVNLAAEDDFVLGGAGGSDVTLRPSESGIGIGAGESGILLAGLSASGIDLEQPNLGGSMVGIQGSDIDNEFLLTPAQEEMSEDLDSSGSQVIALDAADAEIGWDQATTVGRAGAMLPPEQQPMMLPGQVSGLGLGGMGGPAPGMMGAPMSMGPGMMPGPGMMAPMPQSMGLGMESGEPIYIEQDYVPFSFWNVFGLFVCMMMMGVCGLFMMDEMRFMTSWNDNAADPQGEYNVSHYGMVLDPVAGYPQQP